MISEITDIEVTHDLKLKDEYEIEGTILVDGKYKMTDASQIEEEFHYKLPFTIAIDTKYNTKDIEIIIGDFYFEIINEEDLKINVEIDINGLQENKQEPIIEQITLDEAPEILKEIEKIEQTEQLVRDNYYEDIEPIPVETKDSKQKLEVSTDNMINNLEQEISMNLKEELDSSPSVSSIFSSLSSSEETFSTYYVYIVTETDTIESIIEKYNTTREELQNYNNLEDVKVGSKLIIPCPINE